MTEQVKPAHPVKNALAGIIIGSYVKSIAGIALAFCFDSISFAISAITLGLMRGVDSLTGSQSARPSGESIWASIAYSARYLFQHGSLRLIFIVMCLTNLFFTRPLLVGIPVLAPNEIL